MLELLSRGPTRPSVVELLLDLALLLEQLVHLVVGSIGSASFSLIASNSLSEVDDRRLTPSSTIWRTVSLSIELRLLLEEADRVAGARADLALEVLVHAGEDLQQRGFARAVEAQDADLGAVEVGEVDVLEDDLLLVASWRRRSSSR